MVDFKKIPPLDWQTPMVDPKTGFPSAQFLRLWQEMFQNGAFTQGEVAGKADKTTQINTTAPINGGGDLSADRTIGHDESGVVPGVYTSPEVTVDEFGHITDIIDGLGGGVELEEAGVPVTGGPFTTLNFNSGATVVDATGGVADIDITGGGGGGAALKACRVYLTTNMNGINFTSGYIMPWNSSTTEEYDNGGWHDPSTNPSRFTVPAGVNYVDIMFSLHLFNVSGTNNDSVISIYKNGSPINGGPTQLGKQFSAGSEMYFTLTALGLSCAPGDYFEARIYVNDSSADIVTSETSFTIREANVAAGSAGARAYNNNTLSISNTTVTVVTLNSEDFDTSNIHSTSSNTSRMVAPNTGNYRVSYNVPWDSNTSGDRIAFLRKNAAGAGTDSDNVIGSTTKIAGSASSPSNVLTVDLPLAANDYIELFLYQSSGGTRTIGADTTTANKGSAVSLSMVLI